MAPRTRSSTTAIESPRCWLNAASAPMTSSARTRSTMLRCSAIVVSMRRLRQEVVHPHEADALVDLTEEPDGHVVAGRRGQADVERLVEQHEVRVGLRGGLGGERPPLVAQRFEHGRIVARAEPGRTLQRLQLEPGADLVEVAHHGDVGDDRLVAAVGVRADEALGLQALERLPDGRARHLEHRGQPLLAEADVGRELADEQAGLQDAIGPVTLTADGEGDRRLRCAAPVADRSPSRCCPIGGERRQRLFRQCVQRCIQRMNRSSSLISGGPAVSPDVGSARDDRHVGPADAPAGVRCGPRSATAGRRVAHRRRTSGRRPRHPAPGPRSSAR